MEGMELETRREWDPSTVELKVLGRQGEDDIVRWVTDFPWPLSDREYIFRRRLATNEDGSVCSVTRARAASLTSKAPPALLLS
ncbi:hypothetical protein T484DRAFT_1811045 [Baffinella frigidus]|nr:hypothetical protein T484DRAFT_1811045 [Cryptophyta sp. CCMP2293]